MLLLRHMYSEIEKATGYGFNGFPDMARTQAAIHAAEAYRKQAELAVKRLLEGGTRYQEKVDTTRCDSRSQDYSHISGHVTRTAAAVTTTVSASPVVIGSAEDGGGDDGSGEDGGDGDGDGEPPTFAGPATGGEGQHPILLLLLLLLLAFSLLLDTLLVPFLALSWVFWFVPSQRHVWYCLMFAFPDRVREELYRPHYSTFRRDWRRAGRRSRAFRVWMGFCLRLRTVVLFLRCVMATLKEAGIEKGAVPGL